MKKWQQRRWKSRIVEELEQRWLLTVSPQILLESTGSGLVDLQPSIMKGGGDLAYFMATDPQYGRELWRTDGTESGTRMVKDIRPGPESLTNDVLLPDSLLIFDRVFLFVVADPYFGFDLWRTDGTDGGTYRLTSFHDLGQANQVHLLAHTGPAYFRVNLSNGETETWQTDGTIEGTVRLSSDVELPDDRPPARLQDRVSVMIDGKTFAGSLVLDAGGVSVTPRVLTPSNVNVVNVLGGDAKGKWVFFRVRNDAGKGSIWRTDGTTEGTIPIAGTYSGYLDSPYFEAEVEGGFFFSTPETLDSAATDTLWHVDGEEIRAVETFRGRFPRVVQNLGTVGSRLFLRTRVDETWAIDGTVEGTVQLTSVYGLSLPVGVAVRGKLVFSMLDWDRNRTMLVASDGTASGTQVITAGGAFQRGGTSPQLEYQGRHYFVTDGKIFIHDPVVDSDLPTRQVLPEISGVTNLQRVNDLLIIAYGSLIVAYNGRQNQVEQLWRFDRLPASSHFWTNGEIIYWTSDRYLPWNESFPDYTQLIASDGTRSGTQAVANVGGIDPLAGLFVEKQFFFKTNRTTDHKLWRSDGTKEGTVLLADTGPNGFGLDPRYLTSVNGKLYFTADDRVHGRELWISDGTSSGTRLVRDLRSGRLSGDPTNLIAAGDRLVFVANDGVHGRELWTTDGTTAGTVMLADWNSDRNDAPRGPYQFTQVGDDVFFVANNPDRKQTLWKASPNQSPVAVRSDLDDVGKLQPLGHRLLFVAGDASHPRGLWSSDGTLAGTYSLTRFPKSVTVGEMHALDESRAVFTVTTAPDPLGNAADWNGLWGTDGTSAGTKLLTPSRQWWPLGSLVVAGSLAYMAAESPRGGELWVSDGTITGTQLMDLRIGTEGSDPRDLRAVGRHLFFTADDGFSGREVWVSDGTREGTHILADTRRDVTLGSKPRDFIKAGNAVYFVADDGPHGRELWISDSTSTRLVMDFMAGPESTEFGLLIPWKDEVVVTTYETVDSFTVRTNLWLSDGTLSGTRRIATVLKSSKITPERVVELGSRALIVGQNFGFFATDGTIEGTSLVDADTRQLTDSVNGHAYFGRATLEFGSELWRTDGTPEGTRIVADLVPGPGGSAPQVVQRVNDKILFTTYDVPSGHMVFWVTDGTSERTQRLGNLAASFFLTSEPVTAVSWRGRAYFLADDGVHGRELWQTDGTLGGTRMLIDLEPGRGASQIRDLVAAENRLYFVHEDNTYGTELWMSDGTELGTTMVRDIEPGRLGSLPFNLVPWNNHLVFLTRDMNQVTTMWISDGTDEGTAPLDRLLGIPRMSVPREIETFGPDLVWKATAPDNTTKYWRLSDIDVPPVDMFDWLPNAQELRILDGQVYAAVSKNDTGEEPWVSDGTAEGTHLLFDVGQQSLGSEPQLLTAWNGRLAFVADDGVHGRRMWSGDVSQGATPMEFATSTIDVNKITEVISGSRQLFFSQTTARGKDLWSLTAPGTQPSPLFGGETPEHSYLRSIATIGDKLYFVARTVVSGEELWVTDGTFMGTRLVRDIQRGGRDTQIGEFAVVGAQLVFVAITEARGEELWITDGTGQGTLPLADIYPGSQGSDPTELTAIGSQLYFSAISNAYGRSPWFSDLTRRGTHPLLGTDIQTDSANPSNLTLVGNNIYFVADAGTASGIVLGKYDVITGSVMHVFDQLRNLDSLTASGDSLYFVADDGQHGRELWQSNGTLATTRLVRDIAQGAAGSDPTQLTNVHGTLYFAAFDEVHGRELWRSDGSHDGTELLADMVSGVAGADPQNISSLEGVIYYTAWDPERGRKSWWIPPTPGDSNADGRVDSVDLMTLISHFGRKGTRTQGDTNGDRMIDSLDLLEFLANYTDPSSANQARRRARPFG